MWKCEVKRSFFRSLIILSCFHIKVNLSFVVPNVTVQALSPVGFRVSIQDAPGIELFSFEGDINKFLELKASPMIEGDVLFPHENRWTYENLEHTLQLEDVIDYNVFIQHRSLGYYKEGLVFVVTRMVTDTIPIPKEYIPSLESRGDTDSDAYCPFSTTTYNGGQTACRGHLLFEETFKSPLSTEKWNVEHRLPPTDQENPFVYFSKNTVKVQTGGSLEIIPKAVNDVHIREGLDLTRGCTASLAEFCKVEKSFFNIVPPVASGRITTKNLFSFKYGMVEIRARLPQGDWIYPEIYLQPQTLKYGSLGYESGLIRIAFVRGNNRIEHNGFDIGNKQLSAGIILDVTHPCRNTWIVTDDSNTPWVNGFHTYGLIWTEDSIVFEVDGKEYGSVTPPALGFRTYSSECQNFNPQAKLWSNGTVFAPFDEEFYLTIGVGVGGVADFPDDIANKKWTNIDPKAKNQFYKDKRQWNKSWTSRNSLLVESIRVWAN